MAGSSERQGEAVEVQRVDRIKEGETNAADGAIDLDVAIHHDSGSAAGLVRDQTIEDFRAVRLGNRLDADVTREPDFVAVRREGAPVTEITAQQEEVATQHE